MFFFFIFSLHYYIFFLKYILTVFTPTSPPDLTQPNPISSPPSPVNPISSSPTILIHHSFINKAVIIISTYIINQPTRALDQLSSINIHPFIFLLSNTQYRTLEFSPTNLWLIGSHQVDQAVLNTNILQKGFPRYIKISCNIGSLLPNPFEPIPSPNELVGSSEFNIEEDASGSSNVLSQSFILLG